jgi:hypothetical protein
MNDVINELIEITLPGETDEEIRSSFDKVKEVLTRIGVVTRDRKIIQSIHVLQKRGRYFSTF